MGAYLPFSFGSSASSSSFFFFFFFFKLPFFFFSFTFCCTDVVAGPLASSSFLLSFSCYICPDGLTSPSSWMDWHLLAINFGYRICVMLLVWAIVGEWEKFFCALTDIAHFHCTIYSNWLCGSYGGLSWSNSFTAYLMHRSQWDLSFLLKILVNQYMLSYSILLIKFYTPVFMLNKNKAWFYQHYSYTINSFQYSIPF